MLLILMYHRAGPPALGMGNSPTVLETHFAGLRQTANIVLPGEPLEPRRLNVCLTFDDAYADFYFHVFPLLRKFSLRAVLAVPTKFILKDTNLPPETRLAVKQSNAMRDDAFLTQAPFCTWAELREMQTSGRVQMASHSHSHPNMKSAATDVEFEAIHSRQLIEEHLGVRPNAFVYPFGSVNARARKAVRQHYKFDLRVGSALNHVWQPHRQPLCRVPADNLTDLATLLRWSSLAGLRLKMAGNQVRAAFGKWGVD